MLFLILAFFAWRFYQRAREKLLADPTHIEAAHRARLYLACLAGMLAAMAMIAYGKLLNPAFKDSFPDYIFWGEATALTFFGISWLIASRTLWFLTRTGERFRPLRDHNPD